MSDARPTVPSDNASEVSSRFQPRFAEIADLSLIGSRPKEDLQIIRELNQKQSTLLPAEFGSLTFIQNGQAPEATLKNPGRQQEARLDSSESTKIGGRQFNITRDAQGKPLEFKDEKGSWRVKADGQTFVNTADKDQPRYMRGAPSIDKEGNFRFKDTDFGVTVTRMKGGSVRQEMVSASGVHYSIEKNRQGVPTGLEDERGNWTSKDGVTWRNENGDVRSGRPSISLHGEYRFASDKEPQSVPSKELGEAQELRKQINRRYGVDISAPGTRTDYGSADQPSERELRAFDDALSRMPKGSVRGLRIDFLGAGKGDTTGFGSYDENRFQLFQNGRVTPEGWMGLQGVALHELVHHEQLKMRSDLWTGKNPPAEVSDLRLAYGWDYDQRYGNVLLDRFSGRWSPQEDKNHPELGPQTKWVWVGSGSPPEGQHIRNSQDMAKIAKFPMISRYNDHPYESHAEAVGLLRHNPSRLAALSPAIYEATRNWDQKQIDLGHGAGTHIRDVHGRIVANTIENRRARMEMEEKGRLQHLTGHPNSTLFTDSEQQHRPCCQHHNKHKH